MTRLRLELSEFTFTVQHIKGKLNVVADALGRIHIDDIRTVSKRDSDLNELNVLAITRSMSRKLCTESQKSSVENDARGHVAPNDLIVAQEIIKNRNDKIPIIHTQVVSDSTGPNDSQKSVIVSVHPKFRSTQELSRFTVPFIQETAFMQRVFSQLQSTADKLGTKFLKIFVDEPIFGEISVNEFKS